MKSEVNDYVNINKEAILYSWIVFGMGSIMAPRLSGAGLLTLNV
jgi:hypothetical protein